MALTLYDKEVEAAGAIPNLRILDFVSCDVPRASLRWVWSTSSDIILNKDTSEDYICEDRELRARAIHQRTILYPQKCPGKKLSYRFH